MATVTKNETGNAEIAPVASTPHAWRVLQIAAWLVVLASFFPLVQCLFAFCTMKTTVERNDLDRRLTESGVILMPAFACLLANHLLHWAGCRKSRLALLGIVLGCTVTAWAVCRDSYLDSGFISGIPTYSEIGILVGLSMVTSWLEFKGSVKRRMAQCGQIALLMLAGWSLYRYDPPSRHGVGRASSDLRTMGTALESYWIDHNTYPPHTFDPKQKAHWEGASASMPAQQVMTHGAAPLTTPIAYLPRLLDDPCRFLDEKRPFAYYAPEGKTWILISAGPNCVFDMTSDTLSKIFDPKTLAPNEALLSHYTYDPTNGADSPGDVWRLKQ